MAKHTTTLTGKTPSGLRPTAGETRESFSFSCFMPFLTSECLRQRASLTVKVRHAVIITFHLACERGALRVCVKHTSSSRCPAREERIYMGIFPQPAFFCLTRSRTFSFEFSNAQARPPGRLRRSWIGSSEKDTGRTQHPLFSSPRVIYCVQFKDYGRSGFL